MRIFAEVPRGGGVMTVRFVDDGNFHGYFYGNFRVKASIIMAISNPLLACIIDSKVIDLE